MTRTGSTTHTINGVTYDVNYTARWSPREKRTRDYPGCEASCEIEITNIVREDEQIALDDLGDEVYDALIEKAQRNERDTEWPTKDDMRDRYQEMRDGR